jgi:hypothetical protein
MKNLLSKRPVGLVAFIIHSIVFLVFSYDQLTSGEAQSRLLWTLWLPIDFPISLLTIFGLNYIPAVDMKGLLIGGHLLFMV